MWVITEVPGYRDGTRYLLLNKRTGGYLADNSQFGGALHFVDRFACTMVANALNLAETK